MASKVTSTTLANLDKRYISALLIALEERKKNKSIDDETYEILKEKYTKAFDVAEDKSIIREGYSTLIAIAPDPRAIRDSTNQLLERIKNIDNECKRVEGRFEKLDELLIQRKISENVHASKKREYEILLLKMEEQKQILINGVPDSLAILQQMNEGVKERLEELEVDSTVTPSGETKEEKKILEKINRDLKYAAKELSKYSSVDFSESDWDKSQPAAKAEIKPLKQEFATTQTIPEIIIDKKEPIKPPPKTTIWVNWKNITIGKLIGEVNLVGGNYAIIATDRPSLSIIRDIAATGPSKLRSSTNPKVIEDRLKKLIKEAYNIAEDRALLPEYLVKYSIENKIGVDLFRLINSYYASVGRGAINFQGNEAIVNESAQILTLAENVNLLGRRVLAPDRSLIGVIHELYYHPTTSELYTLAFKGVPPQIIRRIYSQTHNRIMADGTFTEFRNEIAKILNIPIYEALTPSSIIRYSLISGNIGNLNQLITLVESMNPRISKIVDISTISNQGVILTRFPQNTLPKIELLEY